MTTVISESTSRPEYLTYIIKLEEEDAEEVERIEKGKREYQKRLNELLQKEKEAEKREKTAKKGLSKDPTSF